MVAKINFSATPVTSDPADVPVVVTGQLKNLQRVSYEQVRRKLEPRVDEKTWNAGIGMLNPTPTDAVPLYMNMATLAALPSKCSRHNAPSRPHALTKLVKSCSSGQDEIFVIVCERSEVFASACALVRAFPQYSRKTSSIAPDSFSPKTKEKSSHVVNVEFICTDGRSVTEEDVPCLNHAARGIQMAARIVDTPCNEMHTDAFLDLIREVGKDLSIKPMIIQGEQLNEKGMGGIYGVGKAAVHKPALAVLSHTPAGATETIAWVGKGIVYDTGGLSIKGKTAMPGMKRDCGGAAGILGAFYAAVSQGFNQNLHALFCLAENAVGPLATRPDDIHTLYSGRTVEINNTDAEGRLVLSDGVAYARRDLKADIIVDMCTLTGAQGVATGRYHAAHMTNTEEWEGFCAVAGRSSGDLSFPVVYCPELHFNEFTSAVADMKNSVADRSNATASCAGLFIGANLGFDYPGVWLHVDMASPVHSGERATGYGVALLNTLFGAHINSAMLKENSPVSVSNGGGSNSDGDGSRSKKARKN